MNSRAQAEPPAPAMSCPQIPSNAELVLKQAGEQFPLQKLSSVIASDAIVAADSESFEPRLWETDGPLDLQNPVKFHLKPGTLVGEMPFGGQSHKCVFWGLGAFEPPIDDEGRSFPSVCLAQSDKNGATDTLELFAYRAAPGKGVLQVKVKPIHLKVHDAAIASKPYMTFFRRLRVASVTGNNATFVVEFAFTGASPYSPQEPLYRAADTVAATLHEGVVTVAGIEFNLTQAGDQWMATPTGNSRNWIKFDCGGSKVAFITH